MTAEDASRLTPFPSAETASCVLTVDLNAIAANFGLLRRQAAKAVCGAVVKADAYGLGVERVAPALFRAGCRTFFVARVEEGVALRGVIGPGAVIFILGGASGGEQEACFEHSLVTVLNGEDQRRSLKAFALKAGRRMPAALQVDTGMARFGFQVREAAALIADAASFEGIDIRLVMSHLACADRPEAAANDRQRCAFEAFRRRLPLVPASLAASSGVFLGSDYHYEMVRPGAALYGIAPAEARRNPMLPVVGLHARVVQVRHATAGTRVGYGWTAALTRRSLLATVGIGYADGFMRSASGAGEAWCGGHRLPVVGRVSMDSTVFDATDAPAGLVQPGALVEIIGPNRDLDAVGAAAGTIGYEVLTSLGPRPHRVYLDS